MAIQDLTASLDLKQNLNIYTTCKQFDNLNLILSIFDNSLQADLTNYDVRLRAMKADNVPLIQQHVGIDVNGNVVNIQADAQLTTTAGNTPIELQFIDKSTGEKKATFNLVLVVVASAIAIEASISKATYTLLEELEKKLDQASDFFEHIGEAIEANTNLETTIANSETAKNNLDGSILAGNTLKESLNNIISTGSILKTNLENDISIGDTLKDDLEETISTGDSLLSSLETFEEQHADVTDISNQLAGINADLSQTTQKVNFLDQLKLQFVYGIVGDGSTDNKNAFKEIFNSIQDYGSIYIPEGEYKINLTDSDLIDLEIGAKNMYTFLKVVGVKGVKIHGQGTLIFDSSACTLNNSIVLFQDCNDITIDGIKFIGDAVFSKDIQIGSGGVNTTTFKHFINGINFEHCENIKFANNTMENIMSCLSVTGCRQSPAINNYSSYDTIVANNTFKNYGQVSTFGGGTSRFIFSNNLCINSLQSGIKLSSNPLTTDNTTIGNSYDILLHDNIFTWEEDFEFPIVGWDTSYNFAPVGIMLECHSKNISIKGNIIDMSRIKQLVTNPIQIPACISVLQGSDNIDYQNKCLDINNNVLIPYSTNNASISIAPFIEDLYIKNNIIKGHIWVKTTTTITKQYKLLSVEDNSFDSLTIPNILSITSGNFKVVNIIGNTFNSDIYDSTSVYKSLIELTKFTVDTLNIMNNVMRTGEIWCYSGSELIVTNLNICNNKLQAFALYTTSVLSYLNINNNIFNASKTIMKVVTNNASAIVNVSGNSGKCTGILNIDNGNLYLFNNALKYSNAAPYSLGSAVLYGGNYIGTGTPSASASFGVNYIDSATGNLYIKKSSSGTTGWYLISSTAV